MQLTGLARNGWSAKSRLVCLFRPGLGRVDGSAGYGERERTKVLGCPKANEHFFSQRGQRCLAKT